MKLNNSWFYLRLAAVSLMISGACRPGTPLVPTPTAVPATPTPAPTPTVVPAIVEQELGPAGGEVVIGGHLTIKVPIEAATQPVRLRVERLQPEEAPPPSPGLAAVGEPVRITLTEGTLTRPVRIELKYDPTRIPEGMPEEALFIARYDEASGRWIGLVNSQVDPTRKFVVAEVERFSLLQVMSFKLGWLLDKAFQSFQAVFGGGVKTIVPVCGPPRGVIVEPVGKAWEVLLVCAERVNNDIVVRVANNRSYGLILFYPAELQQVSREVGGSPELEQLLVDVIDSLEAWVVANPPQALSDRAKRIGIAYLPPGALVTLRGSWEAGDREIGAIAGKYSLLLDATLAFADFLRIVVIVHFGVDTGQFMSLFNVSLGCLNAALIELTEDPRDLSDLWERGLGACFLHAVETAAKEMRLHPIANVLSAAGLVADLGQRLTAFTQVVTDMWTGKWPSVVRIRLPLAAPTNLECRLWRSFPDDHPLADNGTHSFGCSWMDNTDDETGFILEEREPGKRWEKSWIHNLLNMPMIPGERGKGMRYWACCQLFPPPSPPVVEYRIKACWADGRCTPYSNVARLIVEP